MGAIGVVLLVAFIVVCVLLILLVSIQDDGENGMGGIFGGRGSAAFGSHSASVLTKATAVFVTLFFVLAFGLTLVNKKPSIEKDLVVDETATEATAEETTAATESDSADWWAE